MELDVADEESVVKAAKTFDEQTMAGGLDILVHVAGKLSDSHSESLQSEKLFLLSLNEWQIPLNYKVRRRQSTGGRR